MMIEEQLDELIGVVRAMGDELTEIRLVLNSSGAAVAGRNIASDSDESVVPAAPVPEDQPEPEALSKADVMAALRELDQSKGKAAVQEVLAAFKARNLTSLSEDDYPAVIEQAKAAA